MPLTILPASCIPTTFHEQNTPPLSLSTTEQDLHPPALGGRIVKVSFFAAISMVANLEPVRRIRGRFGLRRIGWRFDEFGISESDSEPFAPLPSSAARRARTVSSQSPAPAGNRQPRNYPWILWNLRWNLHLNLTMIKDLNGIQA